MRRRAETTQMSSIVPRFLIRRIVGFIERRLPLPWWDVLSQFWVETRLIFSRAIVLLVLALFATFTWAALMNGERLNEKDVFNMLHYQGLILATLLSMNLWEVEREGRTFELLIMRIPNLHRLIWFKMRIAVFWIATIAMPFFLAYGWFLSVKPGHMIQYYLFIISYGALASFLTCIIASFVHQGLASGIVAFILMQILMFVETVMMENIFRHSAYLDYFFTYLNPQDLHHPKETLTTVKTFWILLANRLYLALAIAGFYWWLKRRLAKTEKWIQ